MNIKEEIEKLKEQIAKLEAMAMAQENEVEDEGEEMMDSPEAESPLQMPKMMKPKMIEPEPSATDDEANMKKSMIMSMMKKKGY